MPGKSGKASVWVAVLSGPKVTTGGRNVIVSKFNLDIVASWNDKDLVSVLKMAAGAALPRAVTFEMLRSNDGGNTITLCKPTRGKSLDGAYVVNEKIKTLYLRPSKSLVKEMSSPTRIQSGSRKSGRSLSAPEVTPDVDKPRRGRPVVKSKPESEQVDSTTRTPGRPTRNSSSNNPDNDTSPQKATRGRPAKNTEQLDSAEKSTNVAGKQARSVSSPRSTAERGRSPVRRSGRSSKTTTQSPEATSKSPSKAVEKLKTPERPMKSPESKHSDMPPRGRGRPPKSPGRPAKSPEKPADSAVKGSTSPAVPARSPSKPAESPSKPAESPSKPAESPRGRGRPTRSRDSKPVVPESAQESVEPKRGPGRPPKTPGGPGKTPGKTPGNQADPGSRPRGRPRRSESESRVSDNETSVKERSASESQVSRRGRPRKESETQVKPASPTAKPSQANKSASNKPSSATAAQKSARPDSQDSGRRRSRSESTSEKADLDKPLEKRQRRMPKKYEDSIDIDEAISGKTESPKKQAASEASSKEEAIVKNPEVKRGRGRPRKDSQVSEVLEKTDNALVIDVAPPGSSETPQAPSVDSADAAVAVKVAEKKPISPLKKKSAVLKVKMDFKAKEKEGNKTSPAGTSSDDVTYLEPNEKLTKVIFKYQPVADGQASPPPVRKIYVPSIDELMHGRKSLEPRQRPVTCLDCGEIVANRDHLYAHKARCESIGMHKVYACQDCPSSYYSRTDLMEHRRREHIASNPSHMMERYGKQELSRYGKQTSPNVGEWDVKGHAVKAKVSSNAGKDYNICICMACRAVFLNNEELEKHTKKMHPEMLEEEPEQQLVQNEKDNVVKEISPKKRGRPKKVVEAKAKVDEEATPEIEVVEESAEATPGTPPRPDTQEYDDGTRRSARKRKPSQLLKESLETEEEVKKVKKLEFTELAKRKSVQFVDDETASQQAIVIAPTEISRKGKGKRSEDEEEGFLCEECDTSCRSAKELEMHIMDVHRIQCQCGMKFGYRADLECHKIVSCKAATWHCFDCGNNFESRQVYNQHKMFCANSKLQCITCGVISLNEKELAKHMSKCTTKAICKVCKLYFTTVNVLEKHMKKRHNMTLEEAAQLQNVAASPPRTTEVEMPQVDAEQDSSPRRSSRISPQKPPEAKVANADKVVKKVVEPERKATETVEASTSNQDSTPVTKTPVSLKVTSEELKQLMSGGQDKLQKFLKERMAEQTSQTATTVQAVSKPATAKPVQTTAAKLTTTVKPTQATVKATPTTVKATQAAVKATPTAVKQTPTAVKATPTAVKQTTTAVKATPTAVKQTTTAVKATPTTAKETSAAAKPTAVVTKASPTVTKPAQVAKVVAKQASTGKPAAAAASAAADDSSAKPQQMQFIVSASQLQELMAGGKGNLEKFLSTQIQSIQKGKSPPTSPVKAASPVKTQPVQQKVMPVIPQQQQAKQPEAKPAKDPRHRRPIPHVSGKKPEAKPAAPAAAAAAPHPSSAPSSAPQSSAYEETINIPVENSSLNIPMSIIQSHIAEGHPPGTTKHLLVTTGEGVPYNVYVNANEDGSNIQIQLEKYEGPVVVPPKPASPPGKPRTIQVVTVNQQEPKAASPVTESAATSVMSQESSKQQPAILRRKRSNTSQTSEVAKIPKLGDLGQYKIHCKDCQMLYDTYQLFTSHPCVQKAQMRKTATAVTPQTSNQTSSPSTSLLTPKTASRRDTYYECSCCHEVFSSMLYFNRHVCSQDSGEWKVQSLGSGGAGDKADPSEVEWLIAEAEDT